MSSETTARSCALGRRREARYVCDILTRCAKPNSPPVPALVVDVSRTGACLLASQSFEQGSVIAFDLPLAGGTVSATVVHVSPASGGWFRIGCAFTEPLGEDCLHSLWQTTPDRRSGERVRVDSPATYECHHCCGVATVADISKSGVCLLVDQPFSVGATLRVQLDGDCMLERSVCVVRVNHQEDGVWACGCSFFHELTDAEMSPFVEQGK